MCRIPGCKLSAGGSSRLRQRCLHPGVLELELFSYLTRTSFLATLNALIIDRSQQAFQGFGLFEKTVARKFSLSTSPNCRSTGTPMSRPAISLAGRNSSTRAASARLRKAALSPPRAFDRCLAFLLCLQHFAEDTLQVSREHHVLHFNSEDVDADLCCFYFNGTWTLCARRG